MYFNCLLLSWAPLNPIIGSFLLLPLLTVINLYLQLCHYDIKITILPSFFYDLLFTVLPLARAWASSYPGLRLKLGMLHTTHFKMNFILKIQFLRIISGITPFSSFSMLYPIRETPSLSSYSAPNLLVSKSPLLHRIFQIIKYLGWSFHHSSYFHYMA